VAAEVPNTIAEDAPKSPTVSKQLLLRSEIAGLGGLTVAGQLLFPTERGGHIGVWNGCADSIRKPHPLQGQQPVEALAVIPLQPV
jgi:hypothetical protein